MIECRASRQLFANFQKQYKLRENLSECEELIGIDLMIQRTKGVLKKLAILRNVIIMSNYRYEVLQWPMVLNSIDKVYVLEYAIADRQEKLPLLFSSWDM